MPIRSWGTSLSAFGEQSSQRFALNKSYKLRRNDAYGLFLFARARRDFRRFLEIIRF